MLGFCFLLPSIDLLKPEAILSVSVRLKRRGEMSKLISENIIIIKNLHIYRIVN